MKKIKIKVVSYPNTKYKEEQETTFGKFLDEFGCFATWGKVDDRDIRVEFNRIKSIASFNYFAAEYSWIFGEHIITEIDE